MQAAVFQWPTPPQFTTPPGVDNSALLVFMDGKRVLGVLVQLLPEQGTLVFLPNHADANATISLSTIRTIRLVTPLRLRKQELRLEGQGQDVFPASDKQTFTVEFNDDDTLMGETIGFVARKEGLYLFVLNEGGKVVRFLLPTQTLKQFQIGAPIGQMLVDEKLATEQDVEAGLKKQQELRSQRIGDYLTAIVTPEQLGVAIERQKSAPQMKLGEALIQEKLITPAQLDEALGKQQKDRKTPLGAILVGMGLVDRSALKRILAKKLGIPAVDLHKFSLEVGVTGLVPLALAQKHNVMPLCRRGADALIVALENPMDWAPQEELRFVTKMTIEPVMATADDITYAINRYYGLKQDASVHEEKDDMALYRSVAGDDAKAGSPASAEAEPLVKLINRAILDAQDRRATEIHIETYSGTQNTKIRFGKSGNQTLYMEVPAVFRQAIVPKIKAMAQMDAAERDKPQTGKIDFGQFGSTSVQMTVATTPTGEGNEELVMTFAK
jgi:hypothetical protein